MKKSILTLTVICFIAITSFAQTPQGINYQAVARDASGNELVNTNLTVQFSVIEDSINGAISWQETHNCITNQFGLYNLILGAGTTTGSGISANFADIEWGKHTHYLKVEIDPGSGLLDMGTTQLLSVPYALYAETSGEGSIGEVRMFALSLTGAVTKAELQAKGWAICDGTAPSTQGITAATITATPDMQQHFIRMSNDESSGGVGGSNAPHSHQIFAKKSSTSAGLWIETGSPNPGVGYYTSTGSVSGVDNSNDYSWANNAYTSKVESVPLYYELAFFIKVK